MPSRTPAEVDDAQTRAFVNEYADAINADYICILHTCKGALMYEADQNPPTSPAALDAEPSKTPREDVVQ